MSGRQTKPVTICVLTYGPHTDLVRQCIGSIVENCDRGLYDLAVGGNAVCPATRRYLTDLERKGAIDKLILSALNLHKSRMMRALIKDLKTPFVWWFDDDSYVTEKAALPHRVARGNAAPREVVMWGQQMRCTRTTAFWEDGDAVAFVRTARWYRGIPPPFWEPGGKGEFDFKGMGTGDGEWHFIPGGCWFARTGSLHALDWPDKRLIILGEDVFLGEAIRQQGWRIENIGSAGTALNTRARRWRIEESPPTV